MTPEMPLELSPIKKKGGVSFLVFWVLKASIDDYTTGMQADGGAFRGSMCIVGCGFPWQHWPHLLITYGNGNMRFSTTWQSDHSKDIIYICVCITWMFKKY